SDVLVRWGGEEFLFIARNTSRGEAAMIAERIRAAVEEHEFAIDDTHSVRLTCSVGFAAFPFIAEDPTRTTWEEVVDVADICLLEQPYVLFFFGRHEADRVAFQFRASRATDAVHVILGDRREIEIDHVRDRLDVDAAGSDVGCNEHANAAAAERRERLRALAL